MVRVIACLACSVFLVGFSTQSSFAQTSEQPDFRGGTISVTSSARDSDGSATYQYTVKQNFTSEDPYRLGLSGVGSRQTFPDSISTESGIDLQSFPYSITSYSGEGVISASRLDCASAQDICRGCITLAFTAQLRTPDIDNDDPQNRSARVWSRFNVLRSTNGQPAAPAYDGDILFRVAKGENLAVDLKKHLDYPDDYECSIQPASFRNGLLNNPRSSTGPIFIDKDACVLRWNIAGATEIEVGNQFNVQVKVKAKRAVNGTSCVPETILDFQIEVGCDRASLLAGDPSCFLCGQRNIRPFIEAIEAEAFDTMRYFRVLRRKLVKGPRGKEDQRETGTRKARVNSRRAIVFFRQILQLSQSDLQSLSETQSFCEAPSSEFCTSSSNLEALEQLQATIGESLRAQKLGRRAGNSVGKARGDSRQKRRRMAEQASARAQTALEVIESNFSQIPLSQNFCGVPAE